jgi:hypothetical protein
MTSPDDDIDDFLRRRRPLFGRDAELEPPLELDRVVLRQAREAIENERPQRMFRTPSWGMPVALAATLVIAFTIILRVGKPEIVKQPQVAVQNVSRQVEIPAAAPPPPAPALGVAAEPEAARAAAPAEAPPAVAQSRESDAVVVDLGAVSAKAEAEPPRVAEQRARRAATMADAAPAAGTATASTESRAETAAATPAPQPAYRRDAKTWLAEIERLRAAGETQLADAELAAYKREHRAYAGAPDR